MLRLRDAIRHGLESALRQRAGGGPPGLPRRTCWSPSVAGDAALSLSRAHPQLPAGRSSMRTVRRAADPDLLLPAPAAAAIVYDRRFWTASRAAVREHQRALRVGHAADVRPPRRFSYWFAGEQARRSSASSPAVRLTPLPSLLIRFGTLAPRLSAMAACFRPRGCGVKGRIRSPAMPTTSTTGRFPFRGERCRPRPGAAGRRAKSWGVVLDGASRKRAPSAADARRCRDSTRSSVRRRGVLSVRSVPSDRSI